MGRPARSADSTRPIIVAPFEPPEIILESLSEAEPRTVSDISTRKQEMILVHHRTGGLTTASQFAAGQFSIPQLNMRDGVGVVLHDLRGRENHSPIALDLGTDAGLVHGLPYPAAELPSASGADEGKTIVLEVLEKNLNRDILGTASLPTDCSKKYGIPVEPNARDHIFEGLSTTFPRKNAEFRKAVGSCLNMKNNIVQPSESSDPFFLESALRCHGCTSFEGKSIPTGKRRIDGRARCSSLYSPRIRQLIVVDIEQRCAPVDRHDSDEWRSPVRGNDPSSSSPALSHSDKNAPKCEETTHADWNGTPAAGSTLRR